MPDAVRTTRTVGFDVTGDGEIDVVEVTEELASGIGVDGTVSKIAVTDTVQADFAMTGRATRSIRSPSRSRRSRRALGNRQLTPQGAWSAGRGNSRRLHSFVLGFLQLLAASARR